MGLCLLTTALAFVASSTESTATPVTFYFAGTVESVVDVNSELDGSVVAGTLMVGSITFESSTADGESDADVGRYEWRNLNGTDAFFEMAVGNYGFQTGPVDPSNQIVVFDNRPIGTTGVLEDTYNIGSRFVQVFGPTFPLFVPAPEAQGAFGISLSNRVDATSLPSPLLDAIMSDSLSVIPPQPSLFQRRDFTISDQIGTKVIRGTLTSLSLTPAPAPDGGSSALMLLGGLLGLAAVRRHLRAA